MEARRGEDLVQELLGRTSVYVERPVFVSRAALNPGWIARVVSLSQIGGMLFTALLLYVSLEYPSNLLAALFLGAFGFIDSVVVYSLVYSSVERALKSFISLVSRFKPRVWDISGRISLSLVMVVEGLTVYVDKNLVACSCNRGEQLSSSVWSVFCKPAMLVARFILAWLGALTALVAYFALTSSLEAFLAGLAALLVILALYALKPRELGVRRICIPDLYGGERLIAIKALTAYVPSLDARRAASFIEKCFESCGYRYALGSSLGLKIGSD